MLAGALGVERGVLVDESVAVKNLRAFGFKGTAAQVLSIFSARKRFQERAANCSRPAQTPWRVLVCMDTAGVDVFGSGRGTAVGQRKHVRERVPGCNRWANWGEWVPRYMLSPGECRRVSGRGGDCGGRWCGLGRRQNPRKLKRCTPSKPQKALGRLVGCMPGFGYGLSRTRWRGRAYHMEDNGCSTEQGAERPKAHSQAGEQRGGAI